MADASEWFEYRGVSIRRLGESAYYYSTSHIELDADGSPRAYGPGDIGIDANANAGYPDGSWRNVLAVDPNDPDVPYVQTAGAHSGFFVSKTSLKDGDAAAIDPAAYVDAEAFPYLVFPGAFYAIKGTGRFGDVAMARRAGSKVDVAVIVADGGPTDAPLGEVSIALAIALGGRRDPIPNPRTGAGLPAGPFECIVFPGSAYQPPWPRTLAEIEARARLLLEQAGGWPD